MITAQFKEFLLNQDNSPSPVTVKNYISDINKFIRWFEVKYQQSFNPQQITPTTIEVFKKEMTASNRSLERYLSSLRKFFNFLRLEGYVPHDPFQQIRDKSAQESAKIDPFDLKGFKNHLYVFNASHLTIKNYIIDVKQFLSWAEEVTRENDSWEVSIQNTADKINSSLVEVYKKRLLTEVGLSPVSVNRKLSSLRKYISWAKQEGIIHQEAEISNIKYQISNNQGVVSAGDPRRAPAVSFANEDVGRGKSETGPRDYSTFPPFSLLQKSKAGLMSIFDAVMVLPLLSAFHKFEYSFWIFQGKPVLTNRFTRIKNLRKSTDRNLRISNIPKGMYAPTQISTKLFPFHKKILHHIKHTRPYWYNRYQNYTFIKYFQFGVLALLMSVLGYALYSNITPNKKQPATFAAPTQPQRILSFQGRLTDNSGNPISEITTLRMAIYNSLTATGSALLWEEIVSPDPDPDGIFGVILGKNNPIPRSLFAENATLYLGVTVGTTAELTPRQQIATVPYAANAETLQGLDPITNTSSTTNVVLALNSSGNLVIGGSANPLFQASGGSFTLAGQTLLLNTNTGSNGDITLTPDGIGKINISKPIQNLTNNNNISTAVGAVEVNDLFAILATSSGQSAFTLNQTSTGPLISASTSGTAMFTVDNSGNITTAGTTLTASSLATFTTAATLGMTSTTTLNLGNAATTNSNASSLNLQTDGIIDVNIAGGSAATGCTIANFTGNLTCSGNIVGATTGISGYWQRANGSLAPTNITDDLLLGSTSTTSAKFAFINVAAGTPTASISANSGNNALYLTGDGTLATTNRQSLTLGNSSTYNTTGNVLINSNGQGNVGIGTANPTSMFSVGSTSQFQVNSTGAIVASTGLLLNSGAINLGATNGTASQCLIGGATAAWGSCFSGGSGSAFWNQTLGALSPNNSTVDLLIGGQATTSAKFAVLNVNSGTPTASISANSGDNALYLTGAGTIQTTNAQSLLLNPNGAGNVGIGTANPTENLTIGSGVDSSLGITTATNNKLYLTTFNDTAYLAINRKSSDGSFANPALGAASLGFVSYSGGAYFDFNTSSQANVNPTFRVRFDEYGKVGINTQTTLSTLDVRNVIGTLSTASVSGATSFASAVVDQSGVGDIFTASRSGATRFVITNDGSITQNSNASTGNAYTMNLNSLSTGIGLNLLSTSTALSTGGLMSLYWNPGSATTSTGDLLSLDVGTNGILGNIFNVKDNGATVFSVSQTAVTSNLPTNFTAPGDVSIAYDINFTNPTASYIKSAAPLYLQSGETFNSSDLTLSTFNKGNVIVDSEAFVTNYSATVSGQLVVGTNTPDSANIGAFYLTNSATFGKALAILNQTGSADIFTASASGTTRFVIQSGGNVGIGTTSPTVNFAVAGSNSVFGGSGNIGTYSAGDSAVEIQASAIGMLGIHGGVSGANSSSLFLESAPTLGFVAIVSQANGSGVVQPIDFYMGGTQIARFTTGRNLVLGGTTALARLDVRGGSGTIPIASFSGQTAFAAMVVDNSGLGDIFTASKSGDTKFVIANNGTTSITINDNNGFFVCKSATSTGLMTLGKCNGSAAQTDITEAVTAPNTEAGDIVEFDSGPLQGENIAPNKKQVYVKKAQGNTKMAGVISTWGIQFDTDRQTSPDDKPLSTAGVIPVKVNLEGGIIRKGDPITSSSIPGVGMKADKPGFIVARATEDFDGSGSEGKVLALLSISWYDPDVYLTDSGTLNLVPTINNNFEVQRDGRTIDRVGAFGDLVVAKLRVGTGDFQVLAVKSLNSVTADFGELTTDSLAIATENITIAGQNLRDYIYSIVDERISDQQLAISNLPAGKAGQPSVKTDIISPLSSKNLTIKLPVPDSLLLIRNSSGSAVTTIDAQGNASFSGKVSSQQLEVSSDASVSGTLRARRIIADEIDLSDEALAKLEGRFSSNSANITNNYYGATQSASTASNSSQLATNSQGSAVSSQQLVVSSGSAIFGDLTAQTATFTQGMMSFGPTSFFEASVADRLYVGSQLSIADNKINVLGANLQIQPLRQGGISFLAGLVEIDVDGNLKVEGNATFAKDLKVNGKLSANIIAPIPGKDLIFELPEVLGPIYPGIAFKNASGSAFLSISNKGDINASGAGTFAKLNLDFVPEAFALSDTEVIATGSAGQVILKANTDEVTVFNENVTQNSLIYITPKTSTPNESIYLLRQVPGVSFTVGISGALTKNVPFNWILIN